MLHYNYFNAIDSFDVQLDEDATIYCVVCASLKSVRKRGQHFSRSTIFWLFLFSNSEHDVCVVHWKLRLPMRCNVVYDVGGLSLLQKTMSQVVSWVRKNEMTISCNDFQKACIAIQLLCRIRWLKATHCKLFMEQLQTSDYRLVDFSCAVRLLNVSKNVLTNGRLLTSCWLSFSSSARWQVDRNQTITMISNLWFCIHCDRRAVLRENKCCWKQL